MSDVTADITVSSVTASVSAFAPSASSGVDVVEWDNDLTEVPALEWDGDYASGITEAQFNAGLSVSGGGLVIDTSAMAGASAAFQARVWLMDEGGPTLGFRTELDVGSYPAGESAKIAYRVHHLASEGAAPSTPSGGATDSGLNFALFKNTSSQPRVQYAIFDGTPPETTGQTYNKVAGAISPVDVSSPAVWGRSNSSYAAANLGATIADQRTVNDELPSTSRLRACLEISRAATAGDATFNVTLIRLYPAAPRS